MKVAVVGGGISGMAAALSFPRGCDVTVFEASRRLGGLLRTEIVEDPNGRFVIERGPDAMITNKPGGVSFIDRLGLEDEVITTNAERRGAYVVCRGALERIPAGFSVVAPGDLAALLRSPVLSASGKARAALEVSLPRGPALPDESLGSFVRRRYGDEVLERLAQPLAGGIYGARPDDLSLRATMPRFLDLEREHRSVTRALENAQRSAAGEKADGARYGLFVSFRRGMQTLPDAMADHLRRTRPGSVALAHRVTALREEQGRVWLTANGARHAFDAVVLAIAAPRVARLLRWFDPTLASHLDRVPYGSAATVTLAYPRAQVAHSLDAFGFVVPAIERRAILASTWSSVKWPGRAPEDTVLLRVFLGGEGADGVASLSDAALIADARRELDRLIGAKGAPLLTRVDRYASAMPRYHVDHLTRVDSIETRTAGLPWLALAGGAYRGVGIPDSLSSGERAASALLR